MYTTMGSPCKGFGCAGITINLFDPIKPSKRTAEVVFSNPAGGYESAVARPFSRPFPLPLERGLFHPLSLWERVRVREFL